MALLLDLLVTGKTRLNDDTYAKNIYADKFIKNGSSDSYVLLGGGGHKKLNDFSMSNHTHSEYLPCLRMRNPSTSNDAPGQGGIPFPLSLKGAGCPVYDDPEFALGTNGVTVYNNASGGAVTLTRILDNQKSSNSSGCILQISTSAGAASPGRGGFIQRIPSKPNGVYAQIFRAKIPVGFNVVVNTENSMGTDYSTHWLTDTAGTGKWEWYIRVTICGTSGDFKFGGHVYLNGTGAVTWYLSYCNVIDLSTGDYDGLRTKYSDIASYVTVNGANSNSNYNMVFCDGSGDKKQLCTSTGIYCNPNTGIMTLNGLSLLNTGDNCLNISGTISSYKKSGTVLSTYNNSSNTIYSDTIYNLGSGNLSINAPGGNLYLSRERGKTYIGGATYYIDRAGNLGSSTSLWNTIWARQAELNILNCTAAATFNGRWHFVPALTSATSADNLADAQIIAGGTSPIVLVRRTGGTVTLPSSTIMDAESGAWVILIKMNTAPCTYKAGSGTKFYLCWEGGSQNASTFTQIQSSFMMFYYNTTWYVTQFTYV